ncbi:MULTISPECIES: hypothetical protein [Acidobacterium]|uniref:hypothetical protein n=1 Tax=Acidobacterium TaxID=33973 RepID=UPI0005A1785F|nr:MULTISPECIES: hypothetical protein [Acidobacterium]HCT62075.1 hypothetical protein [Acidobacterium sp.]
MPTIDILAGSTVFVCKRGRRPRRRCGHCTKRWSTRLCDYPVEHGKRTCDEPLCDECAVSVGNDKDYCPAHARHAKKQGELFAQEGQNHG